MDVRRVSLVQLSTFVLHNLNVNIGIAICVESRSRDFCCHYSLRVYLLRHNNAAESAGIPRQLIGSEGLEVFKIQKARLFYFLWNGLVVV